MVTSDITRTNRLLLELGILCNDATLQQEAGNWDVLGEPTESAIVRAATEHKIYKNELEALFPRISEIPFESSRKLMTTIHKTDRGYRIITKGAPDVLLKRCTKDYHNGKIEAMTSQRMEQIQGVNQKMAERALRVLAVAYLDIMQVPTSMKSEIVEQNLVFVRLNWND